MANQNEEMKTQREEDAGTPEQAGTALQSVAH